VVIVGSTPKFLQDWSIDVRDLPFKDEFLNGNNYNHTKW
jgi:hypothetical protein